MPHRDRASGRAVDGVVPRRLRLRGVGPRPATAPRRTPDVLRRPHSGGPGRGARGAAHRAPGLASRRAARPPRVRRPGRGRVVRLRAGPRPGRRPPALAGRREEVPQRQAHASGRRPADGGHRAARCCPSPRRGVGLGRAVHRRRRRRPRPVDRRTCSPRRRPRAVRLGPAVQGGRQPHHRRPRRRLRLHHLRGRHGRGGPPRGRVGRDRRRRGRGARHPVVERGQPLGRRCRRFGGQGDRSPHRHGHARRHLALHRGPAARCPHHPPAVADVAVLQRAGTPAR